MLRAANPNKGTAARQDRQPDAQSVLRVRGGDLKYSDAERKAVMQGGVLEERSCGNGGCNNALQRSGTDPAAAGESCGKGRRRCTGGSNDRARPRQHRFAGRKGTGDQLAYSSESGEYVLTGTAAVPPRMTDPARGTVTGGALIFNSRDDSVNVEGDGRATTTETTVPKRQ